MAGNAGSGQTVLVTGASAGIGVDLAECFAKNGYDLIITARSEAALGEVGDRLAKTYGVKVAIALPVTAATAMLPAAVMARLSRNTGPGAVPTRRGFCSSALRSTAQRRAE